MVFETNNGWISRLIQMPLVGIILCGDMLTGTLFYIGLKFKSMTAVEQHIGPLVQVLCIQKTLKGVNLCCYWIPWKRKNDVVPFQVEFLHHRNSYDSKVYSEASDLATTTDPQVPLVHQWKKVWFRESRSIIVFRSMVAWRENWN